MASRYIKRWSTTLINCIREMQIKNNEILPHSYQNGYFQKVSDYQQEGREPPSKSWGSARQIGSFRSSVESTAACLQQVEQID